MAPKIDASQSSIEYYFKKIPPSRPPHSPPPSPSPSPSPIPSPSPLTPSPPRTPNESSPSSPIDSLPSPKKNINSPLKKEQSPIYSPIPQIFSRTPLKLNSFSPYNSVQIPPEFPKSHILNSPSLPPSPPFSLPPPPPPPPKQVFLDFGQRDFSFTTCKICGLLFASGVENDEKMHFSFHRNFIEGIPFQGWQSERVVKKIDNLGSRIILVFPDDSRLHLKKVQEIVKLIESELGLSKGWLITENCKIYLFISSTKRVMGCLVAEPIKQGFPLLPPDQNFPLTNSSSSFSLNPVFSPNLVEPDLTLKSCSVYSNKLTHFNSFFSSENRSLSDDNNKDKEFEINTLQDKSDNDNLELGPCFPYPANHVQKRQNFEQKGQSVEAKGQNCDKEMKSSREMSEIFWRMGSSNNNKSMLSKTENENQEPIKKMVEGKYNEMRIGKNVTFFREVTKKKVKDEKKNIIGKNSIMGPPMVSFETSKKASCGVRAIWVHPKERRRGVGRHLLDTLRYTFAYGYVIPPLECAFSQPTSDGRAFAAKYCGTETFLVYR